MASLAAGGEGGAEDPGTMVKGVGSEGFSGLLPPEHLCASVTC